MTHAARGLAAAALAAIAVVTLAGPARADTAGYIPPQFLNQVKPGYPDSARQAGETGEVKAKVLVQPNGKATSFAIFKGSGHKDLDDAVLAAIKASTYKPATNGGKPVLAYLDVTYKFDLKGLAETAGSNSELEQKLAANPNDAHTRELLAVGEINRGEYSRAEDVLQKGTQLDPKNAKFWSLLGFAYYADGNKNKNDDRFKPSAEAYDKSLAIQPKPDAETLRSASIAYGRYAFVLLESQQPAAALPYAQKAARINPSELQFQIELGEALQGTGDNQGALAAFAEAEKLDDHKSANVTARILADKGVTLLALGKESDGIAAINKAEQTAPASPVAYQALASYYIRKGNLDAALAPLSQLAQVNPTDPQVQVDIGDIYVQKKDYVKAKAAYDKALAMSQKNAGALLGLAQIAAAQGDLAGAESGLQRAIAADPKGAAGYNATIAAILLGLPPGKGSDPVPDAVRFSTAATESDPNFANGWYDLGVAYARQGKKDQANTALHHAFDLFKAQNNQTGMEAVNARYKELNGSNIGGFSPTQNNPYNAPPPNMGH
jgi:TonB family protein